MQYTIAGEIAQNVRLDFDQNDTAWAGNGSLMAYTPGIRWRLRIPGGLGGAVRRSMAGEGLALSFIETSQANQHVLLTANAPGHIIAWDLADGPIITTRGSFLAAWGDHVDISVTIARRPGAALFGGAGLFLQRMSGRGTVLVYGSGDFVERQLARNEQMLISTGNLAAFSDTIDYNIQGVGGCRKIVFSKEGFFMTRLQGPGRVLLQTLKRSSKDKS